MRAACLQCYSRESIFTFSFSWGSLRNRISYMLYFIERWNFRAEWVCEREVGQRSRKRKYKALVVSWSQPHKTKQLVAQKHGCLPRQPYWNTPPWERPVERRIGSLFSSFFLSLVFSWLKFDSLDVTSLYSWIVPWSPKAGFHLSHIVRAAII